MDMKTIILTAISLMLFAFILLAIKYDDGIPLEKKCVVIGRGVYVECYEAK